MAIKDNRPLRVLITGGAGFMGRWAAKVFLENDCHVWILDNLSNCTEENIKEFRCRLKGFIKGDIKDKALLSQLFKNNFSICIHMAAAINVHESIDNPKKCFNDNVCGTFNVLEECRKYHTKMVFISSALVYDTARGGQAIKEGHPLNPSCPYIASKIFGENITLSYNRTYDLPVVVLRPFSIYGPWQRSDSEGGVMSIFISRKIAGKPIEVFGSGEQSRDFFYVQECAEFIFKASFCENALGQVFNAGSGQEVKIKDLAGKIAGGINNIRYIKHHHQHAEVMSMRADLSKTRKILGWEPKTSLQAGMQITWDWLKSWNQLNKAKEHLAG